MATNQFSPNWAKRMMRMNTPKVPKRPDMNDPSQAAMGMFNRGLRAGADGSLQPTQNFGGLLAKASQGINSMTRGVKGGQFSSLGQPMNSMYDQNPGFFTRAPAGLGRGDYGNAGGVEGFGQRLAQTREQRVAQSQQDGTFDTIRDKYNQDNSASGRSMNKFGNIMADLNKPQSSEWLTENRPVQFDKSGLPKLPWAGDTAESGQRVSNRQALEQGAAGLKLQRQASGDTPTVTTATNGDKTIQGKYGSGSATFLPPGAKRSEGMVNGRPFSEVMQGLANKQGNLGTGQATDKFQPQTDNFKGVKLANVKLADKRKPLSRA